MALATTTTRTPKVSRCPVCGGLECLCRPRFFAGQLLTEDDLNRLEHYIVGKNKLHNRYLHGTGVVCGLEVTCHQCKGFVTVKSGYALSPCGDDIVLCGDQAVNVCELIQDCRQQQFECESAFPPPQPICGDQDAEWILYVCYDERLSRGVTPLHGTSGAACCSKCSCGGSSSCGCGGTSTSMSMSTSGCGCGGATNSQQLAYRSVPARTVPQCEPTVLCEGYKFQLRRAPTETTRDFGEFINRIEECAKLSQELQKLITGITNVSQVEAVKAKFITIANQHSIYDCGLFKKIADVSSTDINAAKLSFFNIGVEVFSHCLCSTLLPPCAPPAEDNCVPLGTLTINCRDGCNVVKICNVENRRQLVTMPTLKYWLEGVIKAFKLGDLLRRLCCEERELRLEAVSRPDALQNLINHLMKPGETVNRQTIFQHLGLMLKEIATAAKQ